MATVATFLLHLNDEDVAELDRRLLNVLDEYIATEPDRPIHRGLFAIHKLNR